MIEAAAVFWNSQPDRNGPYDRSDGEDDEDPAIGDGLGGGAAVPA